MNMFAFVAQRSGSAAILLLCASCAETSGSIGESPAREAQPVALRPVAGIPEGARLPWVVAGAWDELLAPHLSDIAAEDRVVSEWVLALGYEDEGYISVALMREVMPDAYLWLKSFRLDVTAVTVGREFRTVQRGPR